MIKKHERFFYGMLDDIEYSEILIEFTKILKKKTYAPQYEKISEVIRKIEDRDFEDIKQFKDKVLINTIMITQLARYYWMMGNFDVCSKAYEKQYRNMLDICQAVYPKLWASTSIDSYDLEFYFREFTKNKLLEEFHFPKRDFWYNGGYDAWQFGYAKDVKSLEEKGYAPSELWSVDWTLMKWLAVRVEAFIQEYEDGKFCIILEKKELTRFKKILKFVKAYAEHGTFCYIDKQFDLVDKRSKNGKISQKKLDALWAEFGECLSRLWW